MVPFPSRDDIEFFQTLEFQMRRDAKSLVGREHLSYRSAYMPVKVSLSENPSPLWDNTVWLLHTVRGGRRPVRDVPQAAGRQEAVDSRGDGSHGERADQEARGP